MRLIASDLACRRGERDLFTGLSFTLGEGGALTVTGPNGAGKSSLLALLAGRLAPQAGGIALEGAGDTPLPEISHFIGHRDGLKSALTAGENLAFAQDLLRAPRLSPPEALARVRLAHIQDVPVAYLSAGQKRRVALARLLIAHRPLWLLDEPTAALDAESSALVTGLIGAHLAGGGLVVAATHLPLGLPSAQELTLGGGAP